MASRDVDLSLRKLIWKSGKADLALGLPWIPIYSGAEVILGASLNALLQLIFIDTPRVPVNHLIPGNLRKYIAFGQTLDRKDLAIAIPLVLIAVGFVKLVASFLSSYLIERSGHQVARSLRTAFLERYLKSTGNVLDAKNKDAAANQLLTDTSLLQSFISRGSIGMIRDAFVLVALIVTMIVLAPQAVVGAIVVGVPAFWILRKIAGRLNYYAREGIHLQMAYATRMLQTKTGLLSIFALRSQASEHGELYRRTSDIYAFMRKSFFVRTAFRPIVEFGGLVGLALLVNWRFSLPAELNVVTWSSVLILLALSFQRMKGVATVFTQWPDFRTVYLRLAAQWKALAPDGGAVRTALGSGTRDALEATDIGYIAPTGETILDQCTLKIKRGTRVAVVGASGSGKTTLLRVAAGLVTPSDGQIAIDETALFATQEPYVFKGTVKENITYALGNPESPVQEDFLDQLLMRLGLAHSSSGLQFLRQKKLGFMGEGLSGGERARVAFSRVLYARPRLLLLDEPTANLDQESTDLFWGVVDRWMKSDSSHAVVAVSHSVDDVLDWDWCYVMSAGKIVAEGPPRSVIERGPQ